MNPQKHLNELFLGDLLVRMKEKEVDAVDCFMRLRLYVTVAEEGKTLREVLKERGIGSADYDRLLRAYNKQLAGRRFPRAD